MLSLLSALIFKFIIIIQASAESSVLLETTG